MHVYRNFFLLIFILLFISSITVATRRSAKRTACLVPTETTQQKPVIIFDVVNVLFKESQVGFAQKIGYGILASYAVTHWKNPGHRCLDMLDTISKEDTQKPHISLVLNGKTLPRCIVELHEGKKTCIETKNEIKESIEALDENNYFSSPKEKNLMVTIMNLMLDPDIIHTVTEPIKPMIALAQKLKQNGHPLYVCANVPEEFYMVIQKKYPSIISLFDGIIISAHIKTVKPDNGIFEHLITTHKLDPKECILIDNCKHNVDAAQSLGMRGVVFEKMSGINQFLRKQGVSIS